MSSLKKWIFLLPLVLLLGLGYWLWQKKNIVKTDTENSMQLELNKLRGVAKLVLWEQGFTLHNTQTLKRTYIGIFNSKESITTSINGRMGFHIDLADSINTRISAKGDTIIVEAPLRNTYIELDLGSLKQTKEASLDPTLELKKEEVIKELRKKAIEQVVPGIKDNIRTQDITYQEQKLQQLTGHPVIIKLTDLPNEHYFNWRGL